MKAKACVEGGDPTLLAVREGDKLTLYQLATGGFRLRKNWLEFVGKRVAVKGAVHSKKDTRIIRVDALAVMATSAAEREAANVIGKAIDLRLKDLSGVEQSLSSLKGRIVILNFWATYCIRAVFLCDCEEELEASHRIAACTLCRSCLRNIRA